MTFKRYIHIEKFGNEEVKGIEFGECWVFPKLDGSNASVWKEGDSLLGCGSRNRKLPEALSNTQGPHSEDIRCNDNNGFAQFIGLSREKYLDYFTKFPNHRLYGEWLVPHAFKGYRKEAFHNFYVFDVAVREESDNESSTEHFIPYTSYNTDLEKYGIKYVIPQCTIINPTYENLVHEVKSNTFLCEDGKGPGEGIVIKNYGYYNEFKQQVWAKIISNEFKEQHTKTHGVTSKLFSKQLEELIVDEFCTETLINKEYSKIVNDTGGWSSKLIPRLLNTVFYCLIREEMWEILKKFGMRTTINFSILNALVIQKIKNTRTDLFN